MDDEDEWIGECLLVAGFIAGVVVITLCISVYYVCCHCPRQRNRKAKHSQRRQLREPSVVSTILDSHGHETENQSQGDITTQEFNSVVSMVTHFDVKNAPPPYCVKEDDPPPYSITDVSTEITHAASTEIIAAVQ